MGAAERARLARQLLVESLAALRVGNYNSARDHAQRAAVAQPIAGIVHAVLARAYLDLDDGLAAEAAFGRAVVAVMPAARLHQLVAHARRLQGDTEGALAEAAKAEPRSAYYAARVRARALAASGQPTAARASLVLLTDDAPRDGEAWADLGRLQLTLGDIGGASASTARAVRLLPASPRTLTLAGEVVRPRFGLVAALPWFEAALTHDAYYHPAPIEYAATLGEAGRNVDMLAALRRAMAARPADPAAFYLQAVLAARAGQRDLAAALLARGGGVPGATLLAGALDYAAGRPQQAAARWRDLSAAQPMNMTVRRLLAAALLRSGDAPGALAMLRPLTQRGDAAPAALLLTARAFEATGDRTAAAPFLDRAAGARAAPAAFASDQTLATLALGAATAPTDPTYAIGLIRGLVGSRDIPAAIARARALVAASLGSPAATTALGDALALASRDAVPAYARTADLRFDEPVMLRLVGAQARGGRRREAAALALYLQQNPQSVAGQRLLGHLQLQADEWSAAIETLEGVRARVGNHDVALLVDLAFAYAGDDEAEVALR